MGPENTQSRACQQDAPVIDLGHTLMKLALEVHQTADQCRLIQEAISRLLTDLHHPDLRAEIQFLQGIDLIQQTLEDISALLQTSADSGLGRAMPQQIARDVVRLDSFRERMGLDGAGSDDLPTTSREPQGAVDWL